MSRSRLSKPSEPVRATPAGSSRFDFAIIRDAAADAQRSRLPQMAAALAYRTIFGLLPVIVVALIGLKLFSGPDEIENGIRDALHYAGLSSIVVDEADAGFVGPPLPGGPAAADPAAAQGIEEWIKSLVVRINQISLGAIGVVGAATLIYAALAMLVEIERAFNQIYRVPRGRSWVRRITQYWTLLTLGPIALFLTFYVGEIFGNWFKQQVRSQGLDVGSGTLTAGFLVFAVTAVISTGLLLLAYMTVPNTRVKFIPALIGAAVGAILWEAGKWGFTIYIEYSRTYAQLYGALALIPLFLLWVYVTWAIVLFGLQVSYQLQHGRRKTRAQPFSDMGPTIVDPAAAVSVMTAAARAFQLGQTQTAPALAKAAGLSEGIVRLVVARLAERGLLNRVECGEAEDAENSYALSRPPSAIRASEVLEIGFELAGANTPSGEVVARLRRMQAEAVRDQSLADLVEDPAGLSDNPAHKSPDPVPTGENRSRNGEQSPRGSEPATLTIREGASRES